MLFLVSDAVLVSRITAVKERGTLETRAVSFAEVWSGAGVQSAA